MNIIPSTDNIEEYLKRDDVIDYNNDAITHLADLLFQRANSAIDFIRAAYGIRFHIRQT